ncbi:MAG: hypothetical protein WCV59_03615 [Parcubacteria group bacterium]
MAKKYFITLSVLIVTVVLSGCSLMPTTNTASTEQKITVSPSVWKSTDGGRTWTVKNIASAKPTSIDWDVLRIVVNPTDSNNIFVGLKSGGMMVSVDGGERWKPTIFVSEKVYGLELAPDGRTIYASAVYNGRGKIFKSVDKGENWEEVYTAANDGPLVVAMKLDKNDPQTVYAATSDNLLLKSRDGGGSWKNIFKAEAPIIQIEIDKNDSNLLYILDDGGNVARSKNGGEAFEKITPENSNTMFGSSSGISAIRVGIGAKEIYAAGNNGIAKSGDTGNSWEKINTLNDPESTPVTALAINPQDSKKIVYGSAQAAYESVDSGSSWTAFQFEVSKGITALEYDPQNPDVVWAGFKK